MTHESENLIILITNCNTRYTSTKTQTLFKKTYLFMISERSRRYSHLPHQVANNGINCYDAKLSKHQNILGHNYVYIDLTIDNRYIWLWVKIQLDINLIMIKIHWANMMHHVGAGVYLREVIVSCWTRPLLLYYQNHWYHVTKYENSQW